MEDNVSKLDERASESGCIHGWENREDGKQMAVALSHQHNRRGTQDGHRPPLTLTAFMETPYQTAGMIHF